MKKAIVIFSGGQDSTTCLYWALKEFDKVECITFNYGQKHSVEIEQSRVILARLHGEGFDIKQTVIDISFLNTLVESALTSNGDVNKTNRLGLPDSFVPNRNQLFITLSHSYAQKVGAQHLVTGVCETDYSGYPDCRNEFIKSLALTTNLGSGIQDSSDAISIHTPLMWLNKAATFDLAHDLGYLQEVVDLTHTCYNGKRDLKHDWGYGCGQCPACEVRAKGYKEFLNTIL